jgi:signal transduction histidine kinase
MAPRARPPLSLQTRAGLCLLLIHLVMAAIAVPVVLDNHLWLLAVEALFLASLLASWQLLHTLDTARTIAALGADLLADGEFTTQFRPVGQRDLDALVDVYNRMSDALRGERQRLEEQNLFLERLIAASPGGVLIADLDGRISHANPAACRLLAPLLPATATGRPGSDTLLGQPLAALAGGLLAADSSRVLSLPAGRRLRVNPGTFSDRGFSRRFLLIEELTEELRASERAAWERLVRLVAHEVNNSVGAVRSLLESFAAYSPQLAATDRADFDEALTVASTRLAHLAAFVESYAAVIRLPPPTRTGVDLGRLLERLLVLWRPCAEQRQVRLAFSRRDQLPNVSADPGQLEQALVNVLKNAIEASPDGGEVEVTLAGDSGRPVLTIRDHGPGIPAEVGERLFTPFFTTKRDGRGIGLTLVAEILGAHGLEYALESATGGGARFTIRF